MQTESNIDLLYFNGYCRACNHKEKQQKLRLNSNDFWECEDCHLQLTTFVPYAAILQWRGEGKFRQTIDYAHNHYDKLILTRVCLEAGEEIFLDPREAFYHKIELEDYLETIYDSEEAYHNDQFDPNDRVLKRQEEYLETIATEEWMDLVDLFQEIKQKGMKTNSFHAFHQKLYDAQIIYPFRWMQWVNDIKELRDPSADFSSCSLLQLSMHLTAIFRADRFSDGLFSNVLITVPCIN